MQDQSEALDKRHKNDLRKLPFQTSMQQLIPLRKIYLLGTFSNLTATQYVDESGELQSILEFKEFVFIHYLKRYYFTDDASQNRFIATFNSFVHRNTRDCYQSYSHTFDIDGFEEFTAYSSMGDSKSCVMFYIFTLLGLALPYSCIFERYISRYDVGILKRLTV